MGNYQVVLSGGAQRNLREIFDYLLENVSLHTADDVRKGIEEEIVKLNHAPESKGLLQGHQSELIYRRVLKWSYRIIFTINEEDLQVLVVRIDHAKSNPDRLKDLP